MIIRTILYALAMLALMSCGHDDSSKTELCASPIDVLGEPSDLGYIVSLDDEYDPSLVATEYIENYGDEINVYTTSSTFFAVNMNDSILNTMRCDERVKSIHYDGVASPN